MPRAMSQKTAPGAAIANRAYRRTQAAMPAMSIRFTPRRANMRGISSMKPVSEI